jgi:hypothetical protein
MQVRGDEIGAGLPMAVTKPPEAGMNGANGRSRDKAGSAIQSAFRAIRRNLLAPPIAGAYSSLIAATNPQPKDPTMNAAFTAPIATRFAAFAAAILASTIVLGATVLGMQPEQDAATQVVALDRVVVTAAAIH